MKAAAAVAAAFKSSRFSPSEVRLDLTASGPGGLVHHNPNLDIYNADAAHALPGVLLTVVAVQQRT
ncbi:hypothetical protein C1703_02570 [Streptomyces sp. Go-475]|nr:hypothetical protein C1703_02570 [Streptomyces sp. Go-475]